jgi:hypothetical protein
MCLNNSEEWIIIPKAHRQLILRDIFWNVNSHPLLYLQNKYDFGKPDDFKNGK